MAGVIVLSEIEATIDGVELGAMLGRLAPSSVCIDLGDSDIGRATLALVAIDAIRSRFAHASFSVHARGSANRLIRAHLANSGARVAQLAEPKLVVDLRPSIRRSARWIDGSPPRLEVSAAPYPARRQHAVRHFGDGIRAAGFAPSSASPRLAISRTMEESARALLSRIAPRQPVIVLAPRARGYPKLGEAGQELARRIGARVFTVGAPIDGISRLPENDVMVRASALALSSVVIADSGGWCDVAAAAGAPTVGIFGRASPVRRGPVCKLSLALSAECRNPNAHHPSRARQLRCLSCLGAPTLVEAAEEIAARRWPWDWAARTGLWSRQS